MWFALFPLLACTGSGSQGASAEGPAYHHLTGQVFGTNYNVTWRGELSPAVAKQRIDSALAAVDSQMSTWRPDSDISRARSSPDGLRVDPDTAAVVQYALEIAERSGGAFDPTVQPLVEVWGIHGERRTQAPTAEELALAMERVDYRRVSVQDRGDAGWWLKTGGTALDLSAIAKGFAVDQVHTALGDLAPDRLVEVGGEVRASGKGPNGPWTLGVDRPEPGLEPGSSLVAMVALVEQAMATSGNYRNAYEVEGQSVVHTLDPRQGRPVQTDVLSVTVVAKDCMAADAWATTLMVLDLEEGKRLVESTSELDALWFVSGSTGMRSVSTLGVDWVIRGDGPSDGIQ